MDVWLYQNERRTYAMTIAADGANLPADMGSWKLVRPTKLEGDGFDVVAARQLIDEHGYVCFD